MKPYGDPLLELFQPGIPGKKESLPLPAPHESYIALHAYIQAINRLETFLSGKEQQADLMLAKQDRRKESHPDEPADSDADQL